MCLAGTLALLLVCLPAEGKRAPRRNQKLVARTQFQKAQRMREALNGRPAKERTRGSYDQVIQAYRLVYHRAPASPYANQAVVAVADLLAEEGRVLKDDKYFRYAIDQYNFLRREYPGSRYRFDALFTIGQIQWQDLEQPDQATQTFEEFLKRYPGNHLAEQAKQSLADIRQEAKEAKAAKSARGKKGKKEAEAEPAPAKPEAKEASAEEGPPPSKEGGKLPLVTNIRHWSTPDYTRVAIDLEDEVPYQAGRIADPDRIFFDLQNTKLASELVGKTFDVDDGFLRKIRVGQYLQGQTRVVLEVKDLSEYSAFLLPNPYRLIVDIHGKAPAAA